MSGLKIKLGPKPAPQDDQTPQSAVTPSSAAGPIKLKLNVSQPPTPIDPPGSTVSSQPAGTIVDNKKKKPTQRKQDGPKGKKRAAADDSISPAAKRIQSGAASNPSRKLSIKLAPAGGNAKPPTISLVKKKKGIAPKLVDLRIKGKAPPRAKGVGYDSEDSDTEKDPAIQQAFVLRMQEGEDATYLRQAINDGKIGPSVVSGDAEVSLKFLDKDYRRAVVKIRGRFYAAVLVDLPCILESMKSFDRKGWWKVADISQMLMVLGRCKDEDEARTYRLPREVKSDFQYPHGLTPPMQWVRRRRFRKRLTYKDVVNVDEEVERLLQADEEWERSGGTVTNDSHQQPPEQDQSLEPDYDEDEDADGEAIETVEMDGEEYDEEDFDEEGQEADDDLEAQMQAMFDQDAAENAQPISDTIVESPVPIAEQSAPTLAAEESLDYTESTPVGTPASGGEMETQDEQSSDEDESDEDEADSPGAVDEDAAARAAERAQQLEEVADLEREVERARQKAKAMTNQLLRTREMQKVASLEEDLRVKRAMFEIDPDE